MNNIFCNVLVFGTTKERAINYMEQLIREFKLKDIKKIIKSKHEIRVDLNDGSRYQTMVASQNVRGYRCDKAYIDSLISEEILNCVIIPITKGQTVYF